MPVGMMLFWNTFFTEIMMYIPQKRTELSDFGTLKNSAHIEIDLRELNRICDEL